MSSSDPWDALRARIAALEGARRRPGEHPVLAHGARADGAADDRPAIQRAIDACAAAGGGRVVTAPGIHALRGPLVLRTGVELHVPAGSTLAFSGDPADFLPPVLSRWEGTLCHTYSPLVYAHRARDVALTGAGVLDGGAHHAFASWKSRQKDAQERLRDLGSRGVPVSERRFGEGSFLRPSFLQFLDCERVSIEGVTFRDSPFWVIHPALCREVVIRGVTVESLNANNDGCDPDSCADVLIEDCTFRTGDDGVALKSGRDRDGWWVGRPTCRVLVRRCRLESKINGLCLGSEMSGGIRHVFMEDCDVRDAASALYLKGNRDRGGVIEEVHLRNIRVGRARAAVVRIESNYHSHRGGDHPPAFRGLRVDGVRCASADAYGLFIEGSPSLPVRDVRLTDVVIDRADTPLWLRHADGVVLRDVIIGGRALPRRPEATPDGTPKLRIAF